MPNIAQPPQNRGLTAIAGAMALIVILLIVQIWLLSAALESFLAGSLQAAMPAAVFSGVLFLICLGLYIFVDRVDAEVRLSRRSTRTVKGADNSVIKQQP